MKKEEIKTPETLKNTETKSVGETPSPERNSSSKEERHERRPRRGNRERTPREPKEFEEAILQIDRVTRVVAGGRRLRFRVSVVIGDQKGRVGFGIGKAAEVMLGVQKAVSQAKKQLIQVPIFDGTIPHEIRASFKASNVLLFPAPEGKGIIAGGAVRKILELAGIRDVLSKIHGSRNKINVANATINALQLLHDKAPRKKKGMEGPTLTPEAPKQEKDEEAKSKKSSTSKKPISKPSKK
ncbi:30S ribosomal protein S5 [Candidatus Gracilibacteria bacterium]|nr:30S ribosomal protein S5 [Candidatus Gracilibacteria bacterium]